MAKALSNDVRRKPTLRIWTNPKSVVVGRFQNLSDEVDLEQCDAHEVQIARRFTGGGTVFHDEATLNLTIVGPRDEGSVDLCFQRRNLQLVKEALDDLGSRCSMSGNSILIGGRKVCGSAAAVGQHYIFWHCSILVDANTQLLERVLGPSRLKVHSQFVHSRWQEVTTLTAALSRPICLDEIENGLEKTVEARWSVLLETGSLSPEEEKLSDVLHSSKYTSREWNLNGDRWHEEPEIESHNNRRVRTLNTLDRLNLLDHQLR